MAACANCLICLSSSIRGAGAWFLVLGIVSPTTTTPIGSTHRHKIMSDDAPADVSFKSDLTLVKARCIPKQCLSVLIRASIPALQPWPRRNQRCFCRAARLGLRRPQAGRTTCLTPNWRAAFSLTLFQKPRSAVANRGA